MTRALAEDVREIGVPDTVSAPHGVRIWEEVVY